MISVHFLSLSFTPHYFWAISFTYPLTWWQLFENTVCTRWKIQMHSLFLKLHDCHMLYVLWHFKHIMEKWKSAEEHKSLWIGTDHKQPGLWQHSIPLINARHVTCSFNEVHYRAITRHGVVCAVVVIITAEIKVSPQMKLEWYVVIN